MRTGLISLCLSLLFLFSSCVSTDDEVDLFFMGEDSIQYFFPSRECSSNLDGIWIESDWLYRNYTLENEEGGARTILNLSLYSSNNLYRTVPDQIRITSDHMDIIIPSEQISLVYLDKGKTRYSSWLYSESMDQLMRYSSYDMKITLVFDTDLQFNSDSEFIPQIQYFKEVLLGLPIE